MDRPCDSPREGGKPYRSALKLPAHTADAAALLRTLTLCSLSRSSHPRSVFLERAYIKSLRPKVERSTRSSLKSRLFPTKHFAPHCRVSRTARQRATLDDLLVRLRHGSRGGKARARPAPLRRPALRRHGAHQGRHRRDEEGEGKTLVATLAVYLNALRKGRPRRHRERLSRPPRRRMDGPRLRLLGLTTGVIVHGPR